MRINFVCCLNQYHMVPHIKSGAKVNNEDFPAFHSLLKDFRITFVNLLTFDYFYGAGFWVKSFYLSRPWEIFLFMHFKLKLYMIKILQGDVRWHLLLSMERAYVLYEYKYTSVHTHSALRICHCEICDCTKKNLQMLLYLGMYEGTPTVDLQVLWNP